MSLNVARVAASLHSLAEALGAEVDRSTASTGSVYLRIWHRRGSCTIRVANHADAYASSDYTCDGLEGTPAGARAHLLAALRTSERGLRRLRRLRKRAAQADLAERRRRWIEGYAAQRGVSIEEAAAACRITK